MDWAQALASQVLIGLLTAVGVFHSATPAVLPAHTVAPVKVISTTPTESPIPTNTPTPSIAPTNTPVPTDTPTQTPVYQLVIPNKSLATPTPLPYKDPPAASDDTYYINSAGNQVHSPVYSNTIPSGATARCIDGTYSFSQSRRGTCSHHGGVAEWL